MNNNAGDDTALCSRVLSQTLSKRTQKGEVNMEQWEVSHVMQFLAEQRISICCSGSCEQGC